MQNLSQIDKYATGIHGPCLPPGLDACEVNKKNSVVTAVSAETSDSGERNLTLILSSASFLIDFVCFEIYLLFI